MKFFTSVVTVAAVAAASAESVPNPTVTLNNGVKMPLVALGVWQYDNATAKDAIEKGFSVGFTHFDTAFNYNNQQGVGEALKNFNRTDYFLTTKTPPCASDLTVEECETQTKEQLEYDLEALQLDYVDLVLIHGSSNSDRQGACDQKGCDLDYAQWHVYEDFYQKGKARAIGVSNYCVSCLDCLLTHPDLIVKPVVDQIQYHVGMGDDSTTTDLLTKLVSNEIFPQAYSPLGNGKLISDKDLATIATAHGKAPAQVALKWIANQGLPLVTKADNVDYLKEDLDLFTWNLTKDDMKTLTEKTDPSGSPSWSCGK